jgi:hypothetical protein
MALVIFEKIVLTEGMSVVGKKPATTITNDAASREYSIRS